MKKFYTSTIICCVVLSLVSPTGFLLAVTSKITRQSTAADFMKGETKNVIIKSQGSIELARRTEELDFAAELENVWIINTIVTLPDGTIYAGTSPSGSIIKYKNANAVKIFPLEDKQEPHVSTTTIPKNETDKPTDPNSTETQQLFVNEHVFAMALDAGERLLAGISGNDCRLLRFDNSDPQNVETIFRLNEPSQPGYIFAITLDDVGNIYLGTGPQGKIYSLNPFGKNPRLVYDSQDNNILSLVIDTEGFIYAGTDQRGLVYKIHPRSGKATVLFDSEQNEIASLLIDNRQNLYAVATSAQALHDQEQFTSISMGVAPGRADTPSIPPEKKSDDQKPNEPIQLKIADTKKANSKTTPPPPPEMLRGSAPKEASRIYKINPQGFVTDIFSEMAVFFSILENENKLLLGTGNDALLFSVNPDTEQVAIAYEDKQASQITALAAARGRVYLGTANPAKMIELLPSPAPQGSYTSELIDARQPAKWGKLQIDADIPDGTQIMLSAKSGNVEDPNDPTFSLWSEPIQVTDATQLNCPVGRYCQYKLTLKTQNSEQTDNSPVIREVAVSHVVMNLPPKVLAVNTARSNDKKKPGIFNITYNAKDDNSDKLIYEIEFRKIARTRWIKLIDELTKTKIEWNSRTVEDGRYEVRITADDRRSNTATTALTGSRISDPFVIDNSPPQIQNPLIKTTGKKTTVTFTLIDEFTAIGKVDYTVDSNEKWIATLPDDLVYDTTTEEFTITTEDLDPGSHVLAVKITDDIGNTTYKTFDININ